MMGIKLPKVKFDAGAFGHTLIARRVERWIGQVFATMGKDAVIRMVREDKMILGLLPIELKVHYKRMGEEYREIFPSFTDEEVYGWVPVYWREVIESADTTGDWGMRQVRQIRKYALA